MEKLIVSKKGFTLIELIVVISIVLIFAGVSLVRYNTFSSEQKLKSEGKKLVDVIELAKKKALTSDLQDRNCLNFSGYRLTLNSNNYWLFFCCDSICSNLNSYNLSSDINIISGTGNLDLPPKLANLNFSSSSITLKNNQIGQCVNIFISNIGIVEFDETLVAC